jgi:hypothetical protein
VFATDTDDFDAAVATDTSDKGFNEFGTDIQRHDVLVGFVGFQFGGGTSGFGCCLARNIGRTV